MRRTIDWVTGEEISPKKMHCLVRPGKHAHFDKRLRLITSRKITPEIIQEMSSGTPYTKEERMDNEDIKNILSFSISENFCDKGAAPHFIYPFENESLPGSFPKEQSPPSFPRPKNIEKKITENNGERK